MEEKDQKLGAADAALAPSSPYDGAQAVDFSAIRRCIYCSRRQATPDTLSCAECMRGESLEDIHKRLGVLMTNIRKNTVWMPDEPPKLSLWRRLWAWLRR